MLSPVRPVDQHGAGRIAYDLVGCAAHQYLLDQIEALVTQEDEVKLILLRIAQALPRQFFSRS